MANQMTFKQALGIAFKQWSKEDCLFMIETNKENKHYTLAANVAKYVLAKKFELMVE